MSIESAPPPSTQPDGQVAQPKLLLHICCAPDCATVAERLRRHFRLALFFFDPNIHPYAEYRKRADETRRLADLWGLTYYEGGYDTQRWREAARGLETELEKGARCDVCFDLRLDEAARLAAQEGYPQFTTVLTASRRKEAERVNAWGLLAAEKHGVAFLARDWKKEGGFALGVALTEKYNLYRQDYCGCDFSRIQRDIEEKLRLQRTESATRADSAAQLLLCARITDEVGRTLVIKEESRWGFPRLSAGSEYRKSRDRLAGLLRGSWDLKVRLAAQPTWMEERQAGVARHVLCWDGHAAIPEGWEASRHSLARWLDAEGIWGYRLDPTTAALLARHSAPTEEPPS